MTILQTMYDRMRMTPASLSFLLVLLPIMLVVYYLLPTRTRPAGLLAMSLACYSMAEPGRLLLLCGCIAIDYLAVRLMGIFGEQKRLRLACAAVSVIKNLAVLGVYGAMAQIEGTPPVLGLQIYTLAATGVVAGVYRQTFPAERDPFRFGLHCAFFPKLYAGPLETYVEFVSQVNGVRLDIRQVLSGLGQAAEGAFKTAVIGGSLYNLYREIVRMGARDPASVTTLSAWCIVFCAAFALYYLLSGLGDMAQGIGLAFGYKLPKNFYYPYQSRNVQDFFERFNITFHRFFRDHVRIVPEKYDTLADCLNTLLASILMGLWFGYRINYLLWGVYFALFIVFERRLYPELLKRIPLLFCRIGTLFVVLASFTIFVGETPRESLELIRHMLDFSNPVNDQILYLLSSNWLILLAACFYATNAAGLLIGQFRKAAPRVSSVVMGAVDCSIFVLLIALTY